MNIWQGSRKAVRAKLQGLFRKRWSPAALSDDDRPAFCGAISAYLEGLEMDYMLVSEASKKWGITTRRIQTLLKEGRIPGTDRMGTIWVIPKDAQKPADARINSGKYRKTGQ